MNGLQGALIEVAVQEIPNLIEAFKAVFRSKNPDAPPVTDAQVIAALNSAYFASLAKDDAILNQG